MRKRKPKGTSNNIPRLVALCSVMGMAAMFLTSPSVASVATDAEWPISETAACSEGTQLQDGNAFRGERETSTCYYAGGL